MTYRGTVKRGVVVLESGVSLPEGADVRVRVLDRVGASPGRKTTRARKAPKIMKFAGKAKGLPPDASRNLEHYLYGHPKRTSR